MHSVQGENAKQVEYPKGVEVVCSTILQRGNKILLVKSQKWSDKWTFPGGHVEPGEIVLEAAAREAEEETGLKPKSVKFLTCGELINPKSFFRPAHFVYFDCVADVSDGEVKLEERELHDHKWVTPQEALEMDLAETFSETIQEYIKSLETS